MPVKKIVFKAGINRENTRYTTEGGWYDCDKVRFRYGTPEKIGGWEAISSSTFQGVCRSLSPWASYIGLGTHLKYYVVSGSNYYDITPLRDTATLTNPFTATNGSNVLNVNDTAHGCTTGDFVVFSGATTLGGNVTAGVLNQEFQVVVADANNYQITLPVTANAADAAGSPGGGTVTAAYQVHVGPQYQTPLSGWGSGAWGGGVWGGSTAGEALRIWRADNYGEDLVFGPKGGPLYYWDSSAGLTTRAVALSTLPGASDTPTACNYVLVSDSFRFVLAFGVNDLGSASLDPMLIRWSDQESAVNWTPSATNQAGGLPLSNGSQIVGVLQVRQEVLVWTDTALYSLQYLGPPTVWGTQILAENISLISDRAMSVAAGVTYWMGEDKFYMYSGRVQTLPCDVRQYVFSDFNRSQNLQIFSSTVERFNEVWWFYPSANSQVPNKYVVYNYVENAWYYGTLERTAWIDAGVASDYPIAAYGNKLMYQESGVDDLSTGSPTAIESYITSSEFDIEDGNSFGFVWRVLPDITFRGSTSNSPSATLTLLPLKNSGSGYNAPASVAGSDNGVITRGVTVPVEQFTGQLNIRVRGRQMSLKVGSDGVGVMWQLGSPRIDIRPDGRKT